MNRWDSLSTQCRGSSVTQEQAISLIRMETGPRTIRAPGISGTWWPSLPLLRRWRPRARLSKSWWLGSNRRRLTFICLWHSINPSAPRSSPGRFNPAQLAPRFNSKHPQIPRRHGHYVELLCLCCSAEKSNLLPAEIWWDDGERGFESNSLVWAGDAQD